MDVLVGRQPILDRRNQTVAYELLFRSGSENRFDGTDGSVASTAVIANSFLTIGCNRVLGSKRGFINFTRTLLVEGHASILPKDRVVIEILEDVEPDAEVVESCRKLKEAGYHMALDDVGAADARLPLQPFAEYVKIDWMGTAAAYLAPLCDYFRNLGLRLLAEKVETKEDFAAALACGCELFQGFYFARPEILSARQVPTSKMACLRLLSEIQKTDLNFDSIETLVRPDIGLTQKLLFFVNSAAFPRRSRIGSLPEALVYLGEGNVRKWVILAALPKMASGKPAELVTACLIRARFCELAADQAEPRMRAPSGFLVGLLSLLDVMVGRPLDELVEELGLEAHVADAILGRSRDDGGLRVLLDLAVALERSDFDSALRLAAASGIPLALAGELHVDAMTWADSLSRPGARPDGNG
jgi:EAL and modified HD-GYP domain-containing signal transduction protein